MQKSLRKHIYLAILFSILFFILAWFKPFEQKVQTLDFTLQTTQGMIQADAFARKTTLLYFGYTNCQSVCPMTLHMLSQTLKQLSKSELDKLTVLFITIDNKDTVQEAQNYASSFHPAIIAAKAEEATLKMFTNILNLKYNSNETTQKIIHSGNIFILNPNLQLARVLPFGAEAKEILSAIKSQAVVF